MKNLLRRAGQAFQGLILGALLFGAIVTMVQIETGARVFRYQGF
ncbi:MAG: hypothetical protein P4M00_00265 [Azospirillaceae bacterium]|nr:hypothetical protein [Azospirillaceae bacterium]